MYLMERAGNSSLLFPNSHACLIILKLQSTQLISFLYNSHSLQHSNNSLETCKTPRQPFHVGPTSEKSSALQIPSGCM
jgi:hypothetical protein